ncbi:MAG: putative DNA-binding domain-containing protein [Myxococcota bacterium]
MNLRATQAAVWAHVTGAADPPPLDPAVVEALADYRGDWFERIRRGLADRYPEAEAHLGRRQFAGLVADFLRRTPLRSPVFGDIGGAFAAFAVRFVPEDPILHAAVGGDR